jgi:hypothetical protein
MNKFLFFGILLGYSALGFSQYSGTGLVTQGMGTMTQSNLYTCTGGRTTNIGTITANDQSVWTVPAEVNLSNSNFPFASNLHNVCTGATYANSTLALAALTGNDIVNIDATGELITAYIFADNYFELYINGIPVGKDNVPYTQFNSNIVRFRVNRPFTIAMLLVDWEENLGIGTEISGGFTNHSGDGGMVAVFKDESNTTIAITNNTWKAQTFYTAPIVDLTCPTENGSQRLSNNCLIQDSNDGSAYYGLHWARPSNWQNANFDDASWPNAATFTNAEIGVNNKPAYTNFTNLFDETNNDAQFIWSSNVVLDNEVIVRYTVNGTTSTGSIENNQFQLFPIPTHDFLTIKNKNTFQNNETFQILNTLGKVVLSGILKESIDVRSLNNGIYFMQINSLGKVFTHKIIIQ